MKKLKTQFTLFFIILTTLVSALLIFSYQQIEKEEVRLWQGIAENTFNQLQATISEFLVTEDNRSFSEYRYYFIPETQVTQQVALNVSPLSKLPEHNDFGLIGYFQLRADGSFTTPYLPPKQDYSALTDLEKRAELSSKLKHITEPLQKELANNQKDWDKPEKTFENTKPKGTQQTTQAGSVQKAQKSRSSYYPNPLKKEVLTKITKDDLLKTRAAPSVSGTADVKVMADTEEAVVSNQAQIQTFKEQRVEGLTQEMEEPEEKKQVLPSTPFLFTDPFQARVVEQDILMFYRRVWLDHDMYVQGFALSLPDFCAWLLQGSFHNSRLPGFAKATLALAENITPLSQQTLFKKELGFPLNQFAYTIAYNSLPPLTSRTILNILSGLILALITFGLSVIYRSAAAEIRLSQKRQDFVSAVTHELKTPLTSIRLYSELLTEGWTETEEKKKEYYSLISSETNRLSRLIENVLQLSRLEKKNYRFDLITKNPADDFQQLVTELNPLIHKAHFVFTHKQQSPLPKITYDQDALKQIIITLIDNSIKFSHEALRKEIELSLRAENNQVIWSVTDHGPGVPKPELKKIFDKFYRTENEMTRKTKGTGIGLAMALMLAHGMDAKIQAVNQPEGGLKIDVIFQAKMA